MPFVLAQFGLGDQPWVEPVLAIGVVLISMVVAALVHFAMFPLVVRLTNQTPTELDDILIRAARWPINVGIVVLGLYLSLTITLDLPDGVQGFIDLIAQAVGAFLLVALLGRLVSRGMDWAISEQEKKSRRTVDARLLMMLRRILVVMIYGLGLLLVINTLGIPISPLIAGLGLGGVAVALAIQPTLSNLFAGTYVMTEGVVSPGGLHRDGGRSCGIRAGGGLAQHPPADLEQHAGGGAQRPVCRDNHHQLLRACPSGECVPDLRGQL